MCSGQGGTISYDLAITRPDTFAAIASVRGTLSVTVTSNRPFLSIFTGDAAENLGGSYDNDAADNDFKATFGSSFGSLSFGNVAQTGLAEDFLLGDLAFIGSLHDGGPIGDVDLIYVPDPPTRWLLVLGVLVSALLTSRGPRVKSETDTVFVAGSIPQSPGFRLRFELAASSKRYLSQGWRI